MKAKRTAPNKVTHAAKAKDAERPKSDLLIVAIGASAGGIEAFTDLLRNPRGG